MTAVTPNCWQWRFVWFGLLVFQLRMFCLVSFNKLLEPVYWRMVLSQGQVSLEQRLGTALQTAILLIISLSLFLCCFLNPTCLTHWHILYHTHSSRLPRLSSPGLGCLLNHLAEHCVVYWANWIPQYQNQKMLSSINWLRQLIARDKAKTTSTEKPTNQITRIVTANNWAWQVA